MGPRGAAVQLIGGRPDAGARLQSEATDALQLRQLVFLYYGTLVDNALLFATMPNTISRTIRAATMSTLAAFMSLGMLAVPVKAQSIDTASAWQGRNWLSGMGPGFNQTIGQTITAPTQPSVLRAFGFRLNPVEGAFAIKLYVYEWDAINNRAVGQALYISPMLSVGASGLEIEKLAATEVNVNLKPGEKYVLFGSVAELTTPQDFFSNWGVSSSNPYSAGQMFLLSSSSGSWTSASWNPFFSDLDLAFTADIVYGSVPAAPSITLASRGDGQAAFTVNLSDPGSSPLKHFAVGCTHQGGGATVSATNTSSPVTVLGLTNGTTYDCSATATNQDDWTGPASALVSVTPISAPAITDPGTLPTGRINQPYSLALQATGGVTPYAWSATGLPADLTINPATGIISGTPTAAGMSQATVTVTDDAGQEKSAQFTIVIDPLDLTVTSQTLPGGQVGQAYNASIVVAGGVPPYSFTFTGDLPEGLTLNPTTGAITGTPTKAQTSTFSVTIEDSTLLPQSAMTKAAVHSVTQSFSITVAAAPVVATPTPVPTLGEWGLIALSSLLAMFGLARSRRRQG